jgi:nitroreductase
MTATQHLANPNPASAGPAVVDIKYADHNDLAVMTAHLMQSRQTILPKRLIAPGPDMREIGMMFSAAATAPDHGQLMPWRYIVIPDAARGRLAAVFGAALLERDATATPGQVEQAREKAWRAPLLLLVVVDGGCGDTDVDLPERIVSAGCAVQNLLLVATALGYGSALTSGKALKSTCLRTLFGLGEADQALCFVSVGTVQTRKTPRWRATPIRFVSSLCADGTLQPGFG